MFKYDKCYMAIKKIGGRQVAAWYVIGLIPRTARVPVMGTASALDLSNGHAGLAGHLGEIVLIP